MLVTVIVIGSRPRSPGGSRRLSLLRDSAPIIIIISSGIISITIIIIIMCILFIMFIVFIIIIITITTIIICIIIIIGISRPHGRPGAAARPAAGYFW